MINKTIIDVVLNAADEKGKIAVIKELLNHVSLNYDYNDNKTSHILEMLVEPSTIVKIEDVDIDFINNNLNLITYKPEKYNIRNMKIENVDNIDCIIKVYYEYIEKINEDRDDISYSTSYANINFIDNPGILKKEC